MRAEMHGLVPRGSQGHQPLQKTSPKENSRIHFQPGPSVGWPHPGQQTAAGLPPQPGWMLLFGSDLSAKEGSSWNVTGVGGQGFVSHATPPARHSPGHNLSPSSLGFLLLVGWGLVEQSSLKGSRSVTKSHLSPPKGLDVEGRTPPGPSCFRAWRNSGRREAYAGLADHLARLLQASAWGRSSVIFSTSEKSGLCSKECSFQKV